MEKNSHNTSRGLFTQLRVHGIDGRIFRVMAVATAVAVMVSATLAPWRITTGLLLGGLLSLLNLSWLKRSASLALSVVAHGATPRLGIAQFALRYVVVAATVFLAYTLNVVSLPATILGLCTFVVALFAEALREFYFALIHREEIS